MEALPEKWQNVNCSMQTCDAQILSGNTKNVAVITGAGKNVSVLKHGEYGRIPTNYPVFCGHKGNILDVEFVPYYDDYFATCAEDGLIKLWQVPEKQESEINTPLSTLQGHQRKINVLSFNASSRGVLASTGLDRTIRIWDIQEGSEKHQLIGSQTDYAVDLDWKISGNLLGSTWKDKKYRIYDARQSESVHCVNAHEGSKPSKFTWMGDYSYFITAGFARGQQSREFKFWDLKKPDTPITTVQIDKDMSIIYPTFDGNLDILYFTGKGDSMIRYFDFKDGQFERYSNDHRCSVPGKSYSFIRNYCLNTETMEIAKCLQVTNNNDILQVSVKQPKRGTGFQEDLYPPTAKGYGQSASQFFSGSDAEPLKVTMNPDDQASLVDYSQVLEISGVQQAPKPVQKPPQQQQQQQQPPAQPAQKQFNAPPQAQTTTSNNTNTGSSDNNQQVQELQKELELQRNNYEQQIQQLREENEGLREQLNSKTSDSQQDSKQQILLSINEQLTNLRDIVNDIEQNS